MKALLHQGLSSLEPNQLSRPYSGQKTRRLILDRSCSSSGIPFGKVAPNSEAQSAAPFSASTEREAENEARSQPHPRASSKSPPPKHPQNRERPSCALPVPTKTGAEPGQARGFVTTLPNGSGRVRKVIEALLQKEKPKRPKTPFICEATSR